MHDALRIIHLLSVAAGVGLVGANFLTMRHAASLEPAQRGTLAPLQRRFGAIGMMALVLLWLTGIALYILKGYGATIGSWLMIKLAFVVLLSGLAVAVRVIVARAAANGTAPPPATMRRLISMMFFSSVVAVICAVLAFGSFA